jgi:uncharacterized protein (TIGR00255 family)
MIRSMTAFSRQEEVTEGGTLIWELKSVNHRFSEVSLRLPDELRLLEPKVREHIAQVVKRGKVEANLRLLAQPQTAQPLDIDQELASRVAHASREIDALLYNAAPVSAMDVLRWPGVLKAPQQNLDQLGESALGLLGRALDELLATRDREGARLKDVILERCEAMAVQAAKVRQRLPEIMQALRTRLQERLAALVAELDRERLEQELAILANKADVDEELDRLDTHLAEVRRVLEQDEPVGRRLDFLMQELNREANTLGSKSVDADLSRASVELKVLIEQMREQVQNIE